MALIPLKSKIPLHEVAHGTNKAFFLGGQLKGFAADSSHVDNIMVIYHWSRSSS